MTWLAGELAVSLSRHLDYFNNSNNKSKIYIKSFYLIFIIAFSSSFLSCSVNAGEFRCSSSESHTFPFFIFSIGEYFPSQLSDDGLRDINYSLLLFQSIYFLQLFLKRLINQY